MTEKLSVLTCLESTPCKFLKSYDSSYESNNHFQLLESELHRSPQIIFDDDDFQFLHFVCSAKYVIGYICFTSWFKSQLFFFFHFTKYDI